MGYVSEDFKNSTGGKGYIRRIRDKCRCQHSDSVTPSKSDIGARRFDNKKSGARISLFRTYVGDTKTVPVFAAPDPEGTRC